jgi:hypothetical protein
VVIAIKRRYIRLISLPLISIALAIAVGIWYRYEVRQQRLDRALIAAIKERDSSAAISLLDHGADANARGRHGRTRIMEVDKEQLYPLLIAHGADPDMQDGDGLTALMLLFERWHLSDAGIRFGTQFLLEHGAIASIKDRGGFMALDHANGSKAFIKYFGRHSQGPDAETIRSLKAAMKRERAQAHKSF